MSYLLVVMFMVSSDKNAYVTEKYVTEETCKVRLEQRVAELGDQVIVGECLPTGI